MTKKTDTFSVNGKEQIHLHLHELPKRFIRKGSDAEKYRDDVMRTLQSLQYTYRQLMISSQTCYLNIDSITNKNPYMPTSADVYNSVQDFVYHYENYGMRIFILREKVLLFINAALPVDWPEREVNVRAMLNHSTVKAAKLDKLITKFDSNSTNSLGDMVKNRNQLTHKLYYSKTDHYLRPPMSIASEDDDSDYKEWFKQWKRRIKEKEVMVSNATQELWELNHELSEKIFLYRSN